jgi:origin recognition complex subunit 1
LHCVFLDEFDLLYTQSQSIFYNLFELPNLPNSNLLLIVAANTMNISEKMIEPKIKSRIGNNKIYFKPYNHTQLKNLIKVDKKFTEDSVDLITKRIGSLSGDLRKLKNIIELAKSEECLKIDAAKINKIMNNYSTPIFINFLGCLCFEQKLILYLLKGCEFVSLVLVCRKVETYFNVTKRSGFEVFKVSDCVLDLIDFGIWIKRMW